MAEREGFEPSVPLRIQRFSRPPRSTALASLHSNKSKEGISLPYLCGERGIRTPGALADTTVFKTAAFDRSAISPVLRGAKVALFFILSSKICKISKKNIEQILIPPWLQNYIFQVVSCQVIANTQEIVTKIKK